MPLAPIFLSSRGQTGELDPSRLKTGDLLVAQNCNFSAGNLIEKEGGSTKINAVALSGAPIVMTGFDWWPTPSIQRRVVYTSDGKLYKDDMTGAFGTTLKSGLTVSRVTHMNEGGLESTGRNRKLFICTGVNIVQVESGDAATTANLTTPPADWAGTNQPAFFVLFRGVNIGAGNANDPYRIYASLGADHEDFTTAGVWNLSVYPGEGQKLVGAITAFGKLLLFKHPLGLYTLNDAAAAVSGWFAQPISRQYGMAPTPHAVAQIDEAVVAMVSSTGSIIMLQESVGSLTGVSFTDLSRALNLRSVIRDNFNLGRLDKVQARWYDEAKQLHVVYAAKGGSTENRRLVIDFNTERTRVEITEKDTNSSLWMELDSDLIPRPRSGDTAGFTRKLDQVARTVDGTAYGFRAQTAPTDFSDVDPSFMGLKELSYLHLEFEPTGNFDVSCGIEVDGVGKGTVTFNMGAVGAVLPFDLPGTLTSGGLRRKYRAIVGEGHYVSLNFTESGENNPRLARAWVEFDLVSTRR